MTMLHLDRMLPAHRPGEATGIALTWVHDLRGVISASYGVEALPHMFIIDRDGNLAHVHRGYSAEMIDSFVQEMLALLPAEVLSQPAGG